MALVNVIKSCLLCCVLLFLLPNVSANLLFCRVNIPLEATKSTIDGGNTILPYIPPHPPKGTKYHRYTVAALEQPSQFDVNQVKAERVMNAREFVKDYNLTVRGASFFREVWDEDVTKIYQEILGTSFNHLKPLMLTE